ncbi:MAG: hypothetical protein U0840_16040 [Gemmataceae bacterium]
MLARLILWLTALLLGGGSPEPGPAAPQPPKADIRGVIHSITLEAGKGKQIIGVMRVEGVKEADTQVDKAMVRLTRTTKLYRWVEGKKKEIRAEDLKKGSRVQCNFSGPVAESYPVQGNAGEVLLLADKE